MEGILGNHRLSVFQAQQRGTCPGAFRKSSGRLWCGRVGGRVWGDGQGEGNVETAAEGGEVGEGTRGGGGCERR